MDQLESVGLADSEVIRIKTCASFTSAPFVDALRRWCRLTGLEIEVDPLPDYQVIHHLLQSGTGAMTRLDHVVLTRINDIVGESPSQAAQSMLDEFALAIEKLVEAVNGSVVCCVCPRSATAGDDSFYEELEHRLLESLGRIKLLSLIAPTDVEERYNIPRVHDSYAERYALLPYSDRFLEALGLIVLRRIFHTHHAFELKAIVADCDGTLWNGVCAEDGPSNIHVDDRCTNLQHILLQQCEAGRLICLSSKNREEDVRNAFISAPGMLLRWENIAARRISWERKSSALDSIAYELNVATETMLFLDDNEIECEEVRTAHPEAIILHLSPEGSTAELLEHLWVLDIPSRRNLGVNRTQYFHDEHRRSALLQTTGSFAEYIRLLRLQVEVRPMTADDVDRVLELTARTTQFTNAQGRITVQELKELQSSTETEIHVVTASDRFGDYGVVGVLVTRGGSTLQVQTMLLSCRVLGKGIEHRILASLGERALTTKLNSVVIPLRETERNLPIRTFLEAYGPVTSEDEHGTSKLLTYNAETLANVRYDPDRDRPSAGPKYSRPRNSVLSRTADANIRARRFLETIAQLGRNSSLDAYARIAPLPEMTR